MVHPLAPRRSAPGAAALRDRESGRDVGLMDRPESIWVTTTRQSHDRIYHTTLDCERVRAGMKNKARLDPRKKSNYRQTTPLIAKLRCLRKCALC